MRRVYLVDQDESVRRALGHLLCLEGFEVLSFESPQGFLENLDYAAPGCVIADLELPGMSGLDMFEVMELAGSTLPVIFLTGRTTVPDIVLAMKRGATDLLTKPVRPEELLTAIEEAFRVQEASLRRDSARAAARLRFESLTPREKTVCIKVTQGLLNKQIAGDLGIAEKTIKIHRARVMVKMKAGSVADLVRMVDRLDTSAFLADHAGRLAHAAIGVGSTLLIAGLASPGPDGQSRPTSSFVRRRVLHQEPDKLLSVGGNRYFSS